MLMQIVEFSYIVLVQYMHDMKSHMRCKLDKQC
jgi:hypothetical protein